MESFKRYDIIIIGAGHAGCEAALAAARMGRDVLLLTSNIDAAAQMSCNPAIGGIAKGHLVREIDALGGEMGKNTDRTGIQFRVLNRKKGPAVWASRAQADRRAYSLMMKLALESQERLDIKQETVSRLILENGCAAGVACGSGNVFRAKAVILTAGTFLGGVIHIGERIFPAGRIGESPSVELAVHMRELGFEVGRLKTGTSPRVDGRTVRWEKMERQDGDADPVPFSFSTKKLPDVQMPCYITHTTALTRRSIIDNLHRSPRYSGKIKATGVRYCPSIEDKFVKFPDKETHQVFIEPEGRETREVYLNGVSTSMPYEVQVAIVRSICGLENAEITRPGYAIEYDFFPPTQLYPTLETKAVGGLFFAGQINGTSGYEEAAAQGLMAGINAALKAGGGRGFTLDRSEAYIGVLIDDLVTKGTDEPYRMFSSRAEYRLFLRQDNADIRLMPHGRSLGLISEDQANALADMNSTVAYGLSTLREISVGGISAEQLLRRPGVAYRDINGLPDLGKRVVEQIEIEVKYAGYMERQMKEIARFRKMEGLKIPASIDYSGISALKKEAREKLMKVTPVSIGQAARIPGITPADISILMVLLSKTKQTRV